MSGLVVLEGKWSEQNNLSVKSLFDVLIDINFHSPHKYYYEMFANRAAFQAIVNNICGQYSRNRYLYIGAHGETHQIKGSADTISRTEIRNILRELGGQIKGVFLGSCSFGAEYNAEFLFEGVPASVNWIAGYCESVDWIESSVLDMLFWNTLFKYEQGDENRTANETIALTCQDISNLAPGLAQRWGFKVFKRTPGPGVALTQLIDV